MSNAVIALIFAIGVAGWTYAKVMRQTGNNSSNSLVVAGVVGLLGFIVIFLLTGLLP